MLDIAIRAARSGGDLLRRHFGKAQKIKETHAHDIKLELDVRAQRLIERIILSEFPRHTILGEEGVGGAQDSDYRWVIDPLDGTVNYSYSIPHFCVSIACQRKVDGTACGNIGSKLTPGWTTIIGVVYDPMRDELFTACSGGSARLNGRIIRASSRAALEEAVVSVGFFKTAEVINRSLPHFQRLVHRVRKVRIMGAAALDLAYVACGRYDAYIEYGVRLWDIAAGLLLLERAGGACQVRATPTSYAYDVLATGKMNCRDIVEEF